MKKIILLIAVLIFVQAEAQFDWTPTTIKFKDGTELVGEGNFAVHEALKLMAGSLGVYNPYIRFRENPNADETKFISNDIEKVIMTIEGEEVEFVPIYTKKKKSSPYFVHVLVEGNVTLYIRVYEIANITYLYGPNGAMIHTPRVIHPKWYSESSEFWVKRVNEEEPTPLIRGGFKFRSFKKRLLKYFVGCPKIAEDIKAKKYNRENLTLLVEDYNNCMK